MTIPSKPKLIGLDLAQWLEFVSVQMVGLETLMSSAARFVLTGAKTAMGQNLTSVSSVKRVG
jgi:hypothetical protein